MTKVLVTGANGQLGKSIQKIASNFQELKFVFKDSREMDITDIYAIEKALTGGEYQYCINCAAYTNVEKAEIEPDQAFLVNAESVGNLAKVCLKNGVILIHISTDYVFDGEKAAPYTVRDQPNPINIYGASKLKGEHLVRENLTSYFIIRTSWLYSEFGKNFYKTVLQKIAAKVGMKVTDEQTGCPTHAGNLAKFILNLIYSGSTKYGLHHFTDGKAMTWYDFANEILENLDKGDTIHLEKAKNYHTLAKRPKNSVLK